MRRKLGEWKGHRSLWPGDIVTIKWTEVVGGIINTEKICTGEIKNHMQITHAEVFEFRNEFGYEVGVGAILGSLPYKMEVE